MKENNSISRLDIFKLSTQLSVPFRQKTGAAARVWFWALLIEIYILGVIHINLCHLCQRVSSKISNFKDF